MDDKEIIEVRPIASDDEDFIEDDEYLDEEHPHVYEPKFLDHEPSPEERERFWFSKYRQNPDFIKEINGIQYVMDRRGKILYFLDGRAYKEGGAHQCITTNRNTGYRCCRRMVTGTTVCNRHGAGSPMKGRPGVILTTKSPMSLLQTSMPEKLRSRVIAAITDPKIHDLTEHIAIIDARISELMESLPDEDGTAVAYAQITEAARSIKHAYEQDDSNLEALTPFIRILSANIDTMVADQLQKERVWTELLLLMDQRRRMVGTEANRRKQILAYMTPEQGMRLTQALWSSVERHVNDKSILYLIAEDFKKMLGN
jgi:hypothetical protein